MNYLFVLRACLCLLMIASCSSPEKAMEKGHYTRAMKLATKNILKGKNVDKNKIYLESAADALAKLTLERYNSAENSDVKDWKKNQTEFNKVLSIIGENNIKTKGLVSESYDELCAIKYELDLKIVDYYYDEGKSLLQQAKNSNQSKWARTAYEQFVLSEKQGASLFYNNIDTLKKECITYGSIYVTAPEELRLKSHFLKLVPAHSDLRPDCSLTISYGFLDISESSSSEQKTLSKKVKVGQNTVTDTSGQVSYEDIFQEVYAYENTTEIDFTASQYLTIKVIANNSECYLRTRQVSLQESDSCTEISYTGDMRAAENSSSETCNKSSIRSSLSSQIQSAVARSLYIR